ncbi:hypothetical protein TNCV_4001431 [Trichonephila clavipes]|uniref:Uncharacterized protein n=1 Tax=Trichonephila clavipes TaxID=2585209 RepID=A0A8X6RT89_TRICX|nr:hypothetical protein TNCV_4001431 [Trichonephila clavipes]
MGRSVQLQTLQSEPPSKMRKSIWIPSIIHPQMRKLPPKLVLTNDVSEGFGTLDRIVNNPAYSSEEATLSDGAHFWLNGYVNEQNCRIWSEANPQVYVETPLHLEKLTVWCALWAGGILLQKR